MHKCGGKFPKQWQVIAKIIQWIESVKWISVLLCYTNLMMLNSFLKLLLTWKGQGRVWWAKKINAFFWKPWIKFWKFVCRVNWYHWIHCWSQFQDYVMSGLQLDLLAPFDSRVGVPKPKCFLYWNAQLKLSTWAWEITWLF